MRGQAWAVRVVFASNGMLFATWASRIPAVRDDVHADERGLGFALLFIAVGSLVAMPFSGRLVAGVGARTVLVACIAACCLAYPALALAPDLVVLSAVLLVIGAGSGVWDVAMNVSGHVVERDAGKDLMPGFHAAWSIGTVLGAGVGVLAARAGVDPFWHFAVMNALVLVGGLYCVNVMPDARDETAGNNAEGEHHVVSPAAVMARGKPIEMPSPQSRAPT